MTTNQKEIINALINSILQNGPVYGPSEENFNTLENIIGEEISPEMEVYFVNEFDYRRNWPFKK